MKKKISTLVIGVFYLVYVDFLHAVEFEKLGGAIAKILGTSKAATKTLKVSGAPKEGVKIFYAKSNPKSVAVVNTAIYEPNCTHTWVIGVGLSSLKVEDIRVVEMSCPHAFPTKENSFLSQFRGKGIVDLKSLDKDIHVVAKATGSSELLIGAVKISIQAAEKTKKSLL